MFATKSVHDAVTERSPAYAILAIDSEDRFKDYIAARTAGDTFGTYNNSPYDFQITKNESMMNGFFTRLALTEVNMPWTIPNINATTQEIIVKWQVGAGPDLSANVILNAGFYRPSEIAATLEEKIRALAVDLSGFTMDYGNGQSAVSIPVFSYDAGPIGTKIAFLPLPYNTSDYSFPSTTKQLFDLLGFTDANSVLAEGGDGHMTYCQTTRYVDIVCSQLTYNQALKDTMSQPTARDTLCRLYLGDGPYTGTSTMDPTDPDFCPPGCAPFTIYRQFTNPKFIRWLPNQPVQGNLRFTIYDDNGVALNEVLAEDLYSFGSNWSMTLLVSED